MNTAKVRDLPEQQRRPTAALLSTAAVLAFVAACGTDDGGEPSIGTTSQEPSPDRSTEPSTTGTATTEPSAEAPTDGVPTFPEGTARQTAERSGEWDLVFTDVRVGEHEGFDRIVLEFTGSGTPGWTVNYVDAARLDGSGEHVRLDGDAVLDLYASGTTAPDPAYYSGPERLAAEDGGITDVYVGGTFEGYTQVLVGIEDDRVPFRVFALTDPSRLVMDAVDDGTD